jgi:YidC/Oxa1 family membrane protein insertase
MFMPPPTDDQQAVQQKVMKFMMIFMGIMFYKVASGLCLYFIASTSWSLVERKLLPKSAAKKEAEADASPIPPRSANGNGSAAKKKKRSQRGR